MLPVLDEEPGNQAIGSKDYEFEVRRTMPKVYPCSRCSAEHEEKDLAVVFPPGDSIAFDTLCTLCLGKEHKKRYDACEKRNREFCRLLNSSGLRPHMPTMDAGMKGSPLGRDRWLTRPMAKEDAIKMGRGAAWLALLRAWEAIGKQ